jgi:arylsulfatase A-like enzyme
VTGKIGPEREPGRDFRLDAALSVAAGLWLSAVDALLMMGSSGTSSSNYFLRPFGRLGLSSAAYVLLLLGALGLAVGFVVGFLQKSWVRTPWPWRPATSLLIALGALSLILGLLRAHRLGDIESFERYFTGLLIAVALLSLLALSIPRLAARNAYRSSLRSAGLTAGAMTLLLGLAVFLGPVVNRAFLPRAPRAPLRAAAPNILVLMLDAVRADALSCLNPAGGPTPHIDALASEGLLFRKAIAPAPWTVPSHGSLFTGLFPSQHAAVWEHRSLKREFHTLAEMLYEKGYATVGFSENPNISRSTGFAQGFEDFSEPYLDPQTAILPALIDETLDGMFKVPPTLEYTRESVAHLMLWLRGHALKKGSPPFFAFLNLMAGHMPDYARPEFNPPATFGEAAERVGRLSRMPHRFYLPEFEPQPGDMDVLRTLYQGDVSYLDQRLGRLFDFLRGQNLLDDTAVIIVSDHGENFGDHGLIEHAFCLYNTLLHVPLIIRFPARVPAGSVRDAPVSTIGLFGTILKLAGGPRRVLPPEVAADDLLEAAPGTDILAESENMVGMLRSVMAGEPGAARFNFTPFDKSLRCLYAGDYKLISSSDGRAELYDMAHDWAETKNVAEVQPARVRDMLKKLAAREKALVRPSLDFTPPEVDRRVKEALKSLGYVR